MRNVPIGETGLPFQNFRLSREFSSGTNQKIFYHLHPNRNFREFVANGKQPKTLRNWERVFLSNMASLIWRTVLKMFTVSESKGGEEKVSRICFQIRKREIQKKNVFLLGKCQNWNESSYQSRALRSRCVLI